MVFSQGDVEALGSGLQDHQPDLHRHDQRHDRFRFTGDAGGAGRRTADSGRRSPTLAGTLDLHNGPR